MPGYDDDSQELFKQKPIFHLQCLQQSTTVQEYAPTLDAQSVWRDFETHMSTSSLGLNERYRLHAYVSTTIYDRS